VSDLIVVKEVIRGAFGVTSRAGRRSAHRVGPVPIEKMHTHDFALEDAEEAILTLAGEAAGESSIHSCLLPDRPAAA
jgi:hypothetical protein